MIYNVYYKYIQRYQHTHTNQHGPRYKKSEFKKVRVLKISVKCRTGENVTDDLHDLIVMSDRLQIPVRYDFNKGEASIELLAKDAVEEFFS